MTSPSIATVHRIARALDLSIAQLFAEDADTGRVVRREARRRVAYPGLKAVDEFLTSNAAGRLQVILSTIEPGGGTGADPYTHDSDEEVVVVLEGVLDLWVADEHYVLREGDAITYPVPRPALERQPRVRPARSCCSASRRRATELRTSRSGAGSQRVGTIGEGAGAGPRAVGCGHGATTSGAWPPAPRDPRSRVRPDGARRDAVVGRGRRNTGPLARVDTRARGRADHVAEPDPDSGPDSVAHTGTRRQRRSRRTRSPTSPRPSRRRRTTTTMTARRRPPRRRRPRVRSSRAATSTATRRWSASTPATGVSRPRCSRWPISCSGPATRRTRARATSTS